MQQLKKRARRKLVDITQLTLISMLGLRTSFSCSVSFYRDQAMKTRMLKRLFACPFLFSLLLPIQGCWNLGLLPDCGRLTYKVSLILLSRICLWPKEGGVQYTTVVYNIQERD